MKRLRAPVELAINSAVQTSHRFQSFTFTLRLTRGGGFIFNAEARARIFSTCFASIKKPSWPWFDSIMSTGTGGGKRLRQAVRLVREEQTVRVHRRNRPLAIGVRQRLRQGAAARATSCEISASFTAR